MQASKWKLGPGRRMSRGRTLLGPKSLFKHAQRVWACPSCPVVLVVCGGLCCVSGVAVCLRLSPPAHLEVNECVWRFAAARQSHPLQSAPVSLQPTRGTCLLDRPGAAAGACQ